MMACARADALNKPLNLAVLSTNIGGGEEYILGFLVGSVSAGIINMESRKDHRVNITFVYGNLMELAEEEYQSRLQRYQGNNMLTILVQIRKKLDTFLTTIEAENLPLSLPTPPITGGD